MDGKELLNWITHRGEYLIEVYVATRLPVKMVHPQGKLSYRELSGAKKIVETYCDKLIDNHLRYDYEDKYPWMGFEIFYKWQQEEGWGDNDSPRAEWFLTATYWMPGELTADGKSYDRHHEGIARIDKLSSDTSLGQLKRKLYIGETR
jgi:hypothetical protein